MTYTAGTSMVTEHPRPASFQWPAKKATSGLLCFSQAHASSNKPDVSLYEYPPEYSTNATLPMEKYLRQ